MQAGTASRIRSRARFPMRDLVAQLKNAEGLAALSRETAERYRQQGMPKMAAHHDLCAIKWQGAADGLREQLEYETNEGKK